LDDGDNDPFPTEGFTSVLKRSPGLNEKIKALKQAKLEKEKERKMKEETQARWRTQMQIDLGSLVPGSSLSEVPPWEVELENEETEVGSGSSVVRKY